MAAQENHDAGRRERTPAGLLAWAPGFTHGRSPGSFPSEPDVTGGAADSRPLVASGRPLAPPTPALLLSVTACGGRSDSLGAALPDGAGPGPDGESLRRAVGDSPRWISAAGTRQILRAPRRRHRAATCSRWPDRDAGCIRRCRRTGATLLYALRTGPRRLVPAPLRRSHRAVELATHGRGRAGARCRRTGAWSSTATATSLHLVGASGSPAEHVLRSAGGRAGQRRGVPVVHGRRAVGGATRPSRRGAVDRRRTAPSTQTLVSSDVVARDLPEPDAVARLHGSLAADQARATARLMALRTYPLSSLAGAVQRGRRRRPGERAAQLTTIPRGGRPGAIAYGLGEGRGHRRRQAAGRPRT